MFRPKEIYASIAAIFVQYNHMKQVNGLLSIFKSLSISSVNASISRKRNTLPNIARVGQNSQSSEQPRELWI